MNISGVSSAHGSVSVSGVQGVEATDAAVKTQAEGLSEVHDNISVSVQFQSAILPFQRVCWTSEDSV